eukprot:102911-Prorocentrum_minimum.AAC.1
MGGSANCCQVEQQIFELRALTHQLESERAEKGLPDTHEYEALIKEGIWAQEKVRDPLQTPFRPPLDPL